MAAEFLNADLQVLMDQLRQKAHVMRSWNDIIQKAKTNLMEKRNPLDAEDRIQIQKSLDNLRKTVSVDSCKELLELLEEMCLRINLKFSPLPSSSFGCCVSCESECFSIDVKCRENGVVDKVDISYSDKTRRSCPTLMSAMNERKWDFVEDNLKGLASICQITKDRNNINLETFLVLKTLESNLEMISKEALAKSSLVDAILNSPFGFFVSREAGRLGRIYYFISPYDLLNFKDQCIAEPSETELIRDRKGMWLNLGVQNHADLQTLYVDPKVQQNSKQLPAMYSLELNRELIISDDTLKKLHELTGFRPLTSETGNAFKLAILNHTSSSCLNRSTSLYVKLPDQVHKYNLNSMSNRRLESSILKEIYFSNPAVLPDVLRLLREDSAYISVFSTCLRIVGSKIAGGYWRFELSSAAYGSFESLFEHPWEDGFVSVKFISGAQTTSNTVSLCWLLNGEQKSLGISDEFVTNIFRKCMSIPVTLRAVLKKLMDIKPNEKVLKNMLQTDDSNPDDDEQMDFENENRDVTMSRNENSTNRNNSEMDGNSFNTFNGGMKFWETYNLSKKFLTRFVVNRYDMKKANDFAMKFDDIALNQKLPNMLDLFKEMDEWEELIPPRPGQKPLKSPAPNKQRPQLLQSSSFPVVLPSGQNVVMATNQLAPSQQQQQPLLQQQISTPLQMSTARSPKQRHFSSTSDTHYELDQLFNLSKSVEGAGQGGGGPGSESDSISSTPVSDRPGPILERKSSVQDHTRAQAITQKFYSKAKYCKICTETIDRVASISVMQALSAANNAANQQQQMMHQQNISPVPSGSLPGSGPPPGMGRPNPTLMQSRSFDVDYMSPTHQQQQAQAIRDQRVAMSAGPNSGMDVFEFVDNTDPFENPSLQRWPSYSGDPDGVMPGVPMTYNPDMAMPNYQNQYALRGMLSSTVGRGSGGAGGKRRRSRRNMANVGDRQFDMAMKDMKEQKKVEKAMRGAGKQPRRPRGSRRGAGGTGRGHMEMDHGGKMRAKYMQHHSVMSPTDAEEQHKMMTSDYYQQQQMTPGGGGIPFHHQQQMSSVHQQHHMTYHQGAGGMNAGNMGLKDLMHYKQDYNASSLQLGQQQGGFEIESDGTDDLGTGPPGSGSSSYGKDDSALQITRRQIHDMVHETLVPSFGQQMRGDREESTGSATSFDQRLVESSCLDDMEAACVAGPRGGNLFDNLSAKGGKSAAGAQPPAKHRKSLDDVIRNLAAPPVGGALCSQSSVGSVDESDDAMSVATGNDPLDDGSIMTLSHKRRNNLISYDDEDSSDGIPMQIDSERSVSGDNSNSGGRMYGGNQHSSKTTMESTLSDQPPASSSNNANSLKLVIKKKDLIKDSSKSSHETSPSTGGGGGRTGQPKMTKSSSSEMMSSKLGQDQQMGHQQAANLTVASLQQKLANNAQHMQMMQQKQQQMLQQQNQTQQQPQPEISGDKQKLFGQLKSQIMEKKAKSKKQATISSAPGAPAGVNSKGLGVYSIEHQQTPPPLPGGKVQPPFGGAKLGQQQQPPKQPKAEMKMSQQQMMQQQQQLMQINKQQQHDATAAPPGGESILFGAATAAKTFKNYKIPKIEDNSKGMPQQQQQQMFETSKLPPGGAAATIQSPPRKPPFQPSSQTAKIPKPILKYSSHNTPPPTLPPAHQQYANLQQQQKAETKRRALLPHPPRFTPPFGTYPSEEYGNGGGLQYNYDSQEQARSPDAEGLIIDMAKHSPIGGGEQNLHNSSEMSSPGVSGLRIDMEMYGADDGSGGYRMSESQSQSPEN